MNNFKPTKLLFCAVLAVALSAFSFYILTPKTIYAQAGGTGYGGQGSNPQQQLEIQQRDLESVPQTEQIKQNLEANRIAQGENYKASKKNDICCLHFPETDEGAILYGGLCAESSEFDPTGKDVGITAGIKFSTGDTSPDKDVGGLCVGEMETDSITWSWWRRIRPDNWAADIMQIFMWTCFKIAAWLSYLLSFTLKHLLNSPITTDPAFIPAWQQAKNLGNMMIVLGFILVGISTALRIRNYEAGKLLPKLIGVAILINFSGLLCGLVIDAGNLVTTGLTQYEEAKIGQPATKLSGPGMGEYLLYKMNRVGFKTISEDLDHSDKLWKLSGTIGAFALIYLGMAFTFLYLTIVLIVRYVALLMLYIISPIAFVFFVFSPGTFQKWWGEFIKWAFVGVIASAILFLAAPLAGAIGQQSNVVGIWVSTFIVLAFLWIGFKFTMSKTGIASAVTGAVLSAVGAAATFAGGGLGKLGMAGLQGLMQNTKPGRAVSGFLQEKKLAAMQRLEKMHLAGPSGSYMGRNTDAIKKQAGLLDAQYSSALQNNNSAELERIERLAATGTGIMGAGALTAVSKRGRLHKAFGDLDDPGIRTRVESKLKRMQAFGADGLVDLAEDNNYKIAGAIGTAARTNQLRNNLDQSMPKGALEEIGTELTPELLMGAKKSNVYKLQTLSSGVGTTRDTAKSHLGAIATARDDAHPTTGAHPNPQRFKELDDLHKIVNAL